MSRATRPGRDPGPAMNGRLVTRVFDAFGGRSVTVFVPAVAATAIVFAGDGQRLAAWGGDLAATGLARTMVVGVHRAADEMERIQEYALGASIPGVRSDPGRFAAHERFLLDVVPAWVAATFGVDLPRDRTAVLGVSAGAELALALAMRHPDRFSTVLAASPGAGYRPPDPMPVALPRTYLVAGEQEPFFLENALRWSDALRRGGADVRMEHRRGTHGGRFWRNEFPRMIQWAFP